jgi:tetratricopeptide (TPR) repeat protein
MHRIKRTAAILFLPAAFLLAQTAQPKSEGLSLLGSPLLSEPDKDGRIAKAEEELKKAPTNPELLLAAGRARDASLQYSESIKHYSKAIIHAPADPRFYRMRGHRYISVRKFPEAVTDLERVRALAQSSFEGAYYLGLAYYFNGAYNESANEFARCVNMAGKPDEHAKTLPKGMISCATLHQNLELLLGMADWHWRALRKAGRLDEARDVLKAIPAQAQVRDSVSSYRALLFHKGAMKEAQVLEGLTGQPYANAASALAVAYLADKKTPAACALLKKASAEQWPFFGVIAAEVELAKTSRAACALFR